MGRSRCWRSFAQKATKSYINKQIYVALRLVGSWFGIRRAAMHANAVIACSCGIQRDLGPKLNKGIPGRIQARGRTPS